ncbi:MAG: DUF4998 domain-containing protein [Sphingobacteriales bacterium]|nr:MAG: DUF4998 domain-containing protein [Sphingobacteriales bacterium]
MKLKHIKAVKYFAGIVVLAATITACSKMDDTYKDFIKKGSITYVGTPDSLKIYPGKNRLKLEWLISDVSAKTAKIYWNNKSDSLIVPVVADPGTNIMSVWLNNLREGSYSFDITLYDEENNRSVVTNSIGKVYGDNYVNTLLARPVKSAIFANAKATINWGAADMTVVGTEVTYNDAGGQEHIVRVPVAETITELSNYSMAAYSTFKYKTLYVPDSLSLDTFFTAPQTANVTGPAIEYARGAWVVLSNDFDGDRVPKNLFDNNSKHLQKGEKRLKGVEVVYPIVTGTVAFFLGKKACFQDLQVICRSALVSDMFLTPHVPPGYRDSLP